MPLYRNDRDCFFKYYAADSAKLTLEHTTRKWSTPQLFNDPFDNQFDLDFEEPDLESAAEDVQNFLNILRSPTPLREGQLGSLTVEIELLRQFWRQNPRFEPDESELVELRDLSYGAMRRIQNMMPENNAQVRRILSNVSIFCVSESYDNILMWSHYAQHHTGAVIKFLPLAQIDSPLMCAQEVQYSAQIPRLKFPIELDFDGSKAGVVDKLTLTKSDVWSYEREWRVIGGLRDKSEAFEILPFAPEEIGAVYLGCKMDPNHRREIIAITRQKYPWAQIFEAKRHEREFSLLFDEIG